MKLHQLPKTVAKPRRRLGRGAGSGRGKTAGRGTKGQKARGKVRLGFEGGQLPLIKRLPFRRGKYRNFSYQQKPFPVNVKFLNLLDVGTTVTIKTLIKNRIITTDAAATGVKILGDGELTKKLTVTLPCSKGATAKIEAAGGVVQSEDAKKADDAAKVTKKAAKKSPKKPLA